MFNTKDISNKYKYSKANPEDKITKVYNELIKLSYEERILVLGKLIKWQNSKVK